MAAEQEKKCPYCGNSDVRPSRIHSKDALWQVIFFTPFRCRSCRKRHWVAARRLKRLLLPAVGTGAVIAIIVAAFIYLPPMAGMSLEAMTESDQAAATRELAQQNDAEAQYMLGHMYNEGDGVPPLKAEAVKWLAAAAAQGHAEAQLELAALQVKYGSQDVAQLEQTVEWLVQAAQRGEADAQFMLGTLYAEGQGVIQDFLQAAEWLKKAANGGHAEAMYRLAMMYVIGDGVPKDPVTAYTWLNLAAARGHYPASLARKEISALLDAEQISEAQRRSRQWQPTAAAIAQQSSAAEQHPPE